MNCLTFVPTLEHIASFKTATSLWNAPDIRATMSTFYYEYESAWGEVRDEWLEIENEVFEKLSQLSDLAEYLKKKVSRFIQPVGLQILKWKVLHEKNKYLGISLPKELCWTTQGSVDQKMTAKIIVKDESVDITARYKMACINCLEMDIIELWVRMDKDQRRSFYHNEKNSRVVNHQRELVIAWTYEIERDRRRQMAPYSHAFELATKSGNKPATEYFYRKLTPKEREESLLNCAKYVTKEHNKVIGITTNQVLRENFADVFSFLFSQMEEEQQIQFIKNNSTCSLLCFIDWPLNRYFMDVAKHVWDSTNEFSFHEVLWEIIGKIFDEGNRGDTFKMLFKAFWEMSSESERRDILDVRYIDILVALLESEDQGNVKLLFKHMTQVQREELLSSSTGRAACIELATGKKWNMMKFFIEECKPSKESIIIFKQQLRVCTECLLDDERSGLYEVLELLDDLLQTHGEKRSSEDGQSNSAKKLCNV